MNLVLSIEEKLEMKNEEVKYPISEIFTSPQGEGMWSGTLMTFIRFAGCNVGKHINGLSDGSIFLEKPLDEKNTKNYGVIPIWQEECTTMDGRKFCCDTDFRVKKRLTVKEILDRVPEGVEHICLTGGEPLIHDLEPLILEWLSKDNRLTIWAESVHIETSGTKQPPQFKDENIHIWITVSPKLGCSLEIIQQADEIKLLVDKDFNEEFMEKLVKDTMAIVWLSPINSISELDKSNMELCIRIQQRHPTWRLTLQSQKIWRVK